MGYEELLEIAKAMVEDNRLANKYKELAKYQTALGIEIVTYTVYENKGKRHTLRIQSLDGDTLFTKEKIEV